ncbi:TcpQ domain-containing protein [Bordetella genomosp. 12]|uniref:Toxin co-regulated pilus biosynthesis protein Q C-terminal domain-containing protein n=1 Tax=Bordetella genomosp. 12 TaxID=463035 RepID=A0A261VIM0_9BORD|nr:TcpQ domain-containing protein [Bordetella genomosp. 12]OZI73994.1 hypothetical protein CAL22_05700 [Bordetella genomosp. 12]
MRGFISFLALLLLGGCQSAAPTVWQVAPAAFDFGWQLSGDAEVAPLQVFASPDEVWLQFAPQQALPAVFGQGPAGEQPLPMLRREPYVVVPGRWQTLIMRGGHRLAYARRAAVDEPGLPQPEPLPGSEPEPEPEPATPSGGTPAVSPAGPIGPAVRAPAFVAGPPDATLRAVLARWASQAGWTFSAEHWALNVDIPLQGQAQFDGGFKEAVRELLRATELSDRPVQPCFYANQVLRVVPLAQACDRSRGAAT